MVIDVAAFDGILNPKSVAVVGDKKESGYMWLNAMSTFRGPVYSVQVDDRETPGIEALGIKNYSSLLNIPGPVDYVVVAVPRKIAPKILEDCIAKQVGGAAFFTSGFAETATEEGIALEKILTERAQQANFMLVGPNCMGIFVPKIGLRFNSDQYTGEGGEVAFIGQSGTHSLYFSLLGALHGVKVSKMVSFGNGVVLDSPDYLEYMGQDSETRIIGMYVEGFKDGRRFFETLRRVARQKPVLLWKGGQTADGARAVASHTASLATKNAVWESLVRQCGAIPVDSLDEMIDVMKALLYFKPSTGTRMGILALTGGQSVAAADAYAKVGLQIPLLADESYRELATFFNVIGASYRNPFDVSSNFPSLDTLGRLLEILETDENIDATMAELSTSMLARREALDEGYTDDLLEFLAHHRERSRKPFFATIIPVDREDEAIRLRDRLMEKRIPSFPSFQRSANAYKKATDYYRLEI